MPILSIALALILVVIAVLLVVLVILYVRNYRRYGALTPPAPAKMPGNVAPAAAAPDVLPGLPAAASALTTAYLEQISADGTIVRFALNRPFTIIGRDPACDIRIGEQFVAISRRHAQIAREENGYVLSDLNSGSGVYVDGARVGRNRVRDGAVIQIGQDVQFTFHQVPFRGER